MQAGLLRLYYRYTTYQAGQTKYTLHVNNNNGVAASFSYTVKGSKSKEKPTLIFVHGLSSNKEAWIPIIKNISVNYHCITLDLPSHGETTGLQEDMYSIDTFVEKLKLFLDNMGLTDPMCLIGASMGASIVCLFAIKYPRYVSMVCLLAPIANKASEADLIRELHTGVYNTLLPETPQDFRRMIDTLTTRRPQFPSLFVNGYLQMSSRWLSEHKKIINSLFKYHYSQIENYYEPLRRFNFPTLILWGRQDRVFTYTGAEYFHKLIPNSKCIIFEDCGHVMAIDKPEDTVRAILTFYDKCVNHQAN